MKIIVSVILVSLALAGCASSVSSTTEPQNTTPIARPFAEPATANPTAQIGTTEKTFPSAKVLSATGGPPRLLLVPGEGTPASSNPTPTPIALAGWKTFNSVALQVSVNYPPDWIVTEQTNGAMFVSQSGEIISLQALTPNDLTNEEQQCATLITASGQKANLCLEADVYSAKFNIQLVDGSSETFLISTSNRSALNVYQEMINSLHPMQ